MNNKKKMVLGAAFIVAIMALAGVGYAVAEFSSYQGTTNNSTATNEYDIDYIVVELNSEAYSNAANLVMTYNTVTDINESAVRKTYTWTGSSAIQHVVTFTVPNQTSDSFAVTVTPTAAPSGYTLYYKVGAATEITSSTLTQWTAYDSSTYTPPTLDFSSATTATYTISWALVPTTQSGTTAPASATVTMGSIEYTVVGTQSS